MIAFDTQSQKLFCSRFVSVFVGVILTQVLTVFLFIPFGAYAQGKRIDLSDLSKLVNLKAPQISPDGKNIVLVTSRPNFEDNRYENELVLVNISTGTQRVLAYNRPRVRHPRWSPAGNRLAFLAGDKTGKLQLFVLPMNGGDAKPITNASRGVKLFTWRPDGIDLAFVAEDEPEQKSGEEKHNKSFEVGDNSYLTKSEPMPSHIWLISADGKTTRRLTSGLGGVSTYFPTGINWSPDGETIAFISQPRPQSGEIVHRSLKILNVASTAQHVVVAGPTFISLPMFSSNGRSVTYLRPVEPEPWCNPASAFLVPVSGGESVNATPDIDRNLDARRASGYRWMPDGKSLLTLGNDRTRASFWLQPLGGKPQKIDLGSVDPLTSDPLSSFSISGNGSFAFIGVEPQRPAELYYMSSTSSSPERVTNFNDELASYNLGSVEAISWSGPDQFEENGILVFPPDFDKNKKYPLVLSIHGGPMYASKEGFSIFHQLLAAKGWIVFSPNYRGSDNMGREYQRAIINDTGDGPGRDVMAGIAEVIAQGFVDEDRIAVSGWSYGGFMTTWLISHYHIWKAAVAGAAVTDWLDYYNASDINLWPGYGLGGSPWLNNNLQNYWKQSPITYAHNIQTPTLILSNTGDERVPVTQSYKLYHALKDNGVPVQFIAYPISGHFPADPVHRKDVYRRWIDWIKQHFEMTLRSSEK